MDLLPPELLYQIALESPFETLISLCQTNQFYWALCADDHFWKNKFLRDYPNYVSLKPVSLSFKQAYLDLAQHNAQVVPVLYRNKEIGVIWLMQAADPQEIILNMMQETIPLEERPDSVLILYNTVSGRRKKLTFPLTEEVAFLEVVPGYIYLIHRRSADEPPQLVTVGQVAPWARR